VHTIRQSLQLLMGWSELLLEPKVSEKTKQRYLGLILDEIRKINQELGRCPVADDQGD
jgi:hypothetical protein